MLDKPREHHAQPENKEAQDHAREDVREGIKGFAVFGEVRGFKNERRECREGAAKADHEEQPRGGAEKEFFFREYGQETDRETTDEIDHQGPERERNA